MPTFRFLPAHVFAATNMQWECKACHTRTRYFDAGHVCPRLPVLGRNGETKVMSTKEVGQAIADAALPETQRRAMVEAVIRTAALEPAEAQTLEWFADGND